MATTRRKPAAKKRPAKKRTSKKSTRPKLLIVLTLLFAILAIVLCWSHSQGYKIPAKEAESSKTEAVKTIDTPKANLNPKDLSAKKATTSEPNTKSILCGSLELPLFENSEYVVHNTDGRYTIYYDPQRCNTSWVAYKLTASDISAGAGRSSSFTADRTLAKRGFRVASNTDYKGSGYDKGHLLPSADRSISQQENRATFILSNVSPQLPELNRGTWKTLEEQIRKLCREVDTIYIVAGAMDYRTEEIIGDNRIAVPTNFFKVILTRTKNSFSGIGYIMPNDRNIQKNIELYKVSIDSIEKIIGYNFFYQLPPKIEDIIEQNSSSIFK